MKTDELKLDELLRYAFCGISLCASAIFARSSTPVFPMALRSAEVIAVLTAVAVVCGAAFYSAYRACVYPILGRLALWCAIRKQQKIRIRFCHLCPTLVPQAEFSRDRFRWWLRDDKGKGHPHLYEWGSQIHLLYTVALSMWLGSVIGVSFLSKSTPTNWLSLAFWSFDCRIAIPSFALFVAGFISDVRKRRIEEIFYSRRCDLQNWKD